MSSGSARRRNTAPSSDSSNITVSPGLRFSFWRTRAGTVAWPLLVRRLLATGRLVARLAAPVLGRRLGEAMRITFLQYYQLGKHFRSSCLWARHTTALRTARFLGVRRSRRRSACDHLPNPRERLEQIDRQRKDRRRIMLGRDLGERLQIAQLQRDRAVPHDLGRLGQPLRRLEFSLCRDHLGAPLALGLGLRRDRPLHILRQVDILELDQRDLDPPGLRLRVDNLLYLGVELLALAQEIVEFRLAADRSERRLRKLKRRIKIVAHLGHRARRIDHPKVQHRADLDRNVVARDYVLRRDLQRHRAQVDSHLGFENWDYEDYTRPAIGHQPSEPENHRPLIFLQDLESAQEKKHADCDQHADSYWHKMLLSVFRGGGLPGRW